MRFRVKAMEKGKGITAFSLEAASAEAAREIIERQGLRILSVRRVQGLAQGFSAWRRQSFPLLPFSQELATLLDAGLPLILALESLAEKEDDTGARKTLQAVIRRLQEGKSFSQALEEFPEVFPQLYVALLRASERTGTLADALRRFVAYQSGTDRLRQRLASASVYPVLLVVVGFGVMLFLLGYVVPRFGAVFADLGDRLPLLSQWLLALGRLIHDNALAVLASGIALAVALAAALCTQSVRDVLAHAIGRIPAIRNRLFLFQLTRLYRSLGILQRSGIPLVAALGMTRGLLGNEMRKRLDEACRSVREGLPLSRALEQSRLTTPIALRMLHAGEQSGNLGEMMERTADFYDEEMSRWIDWFVRLFEPFLMVFVGGVVGVVVILMYIPIFELAGSLQ